MTKHEKTEFGQFLVDQIKAAGMSQLEFCNKADIARPYFYDLLKSAPPPPETQRKILATLDGATGPDPERERKLFDLAAQGRGEIPADIDALIKADPRQWDQIRAALEQLQPVKR